MNRAYKTVLKILFIAYIIVLYGIVAPAHGHEDLLEHHQCLLCQLSGMTATVAVVFVLVIASVGLAAVSMKTLRLFTPTFESAHPTRAPPIS